jgi:hypothetical protein
MLKCEGNLVGGLPETYLLNSALALGAHFGAGYSSLLQVQVRPNDLQIVLPDLFPAASRLHLRKW